MTCDKPLLFISDIGDAPFYLAKITLAQEIKAVDNRRQNIF
jgi:hypothetical protein